MSHPFFGHERYSLLLSLDERERAGVLNVDTSGIHYWNVLEMKFK